ncbi:acetolactate synthase 2 small subunit [Budviciaceae bacterium BWR-B9]|uniref:Acetolactate synthase 2 small subunit n=4 Tax=Limnobaculum TaxID=2172100 RepID=A0A9D7AL57_9GAMM|nr:MULTISPECIES: acetolactate synthase 2 small subunit [Limnobaculum]MBK5074880.1 acetolactate synthase 2 small subunit [Limnobaculum xujianqingii]MBK5145522.1 acetolactate synthase 2 small subunit [Limnobaculum allomyrinae]MBK5178244.1 acetolactate synthase 2 small subunit [Limnobaculum xujianqingii]MBV7693641.1 acetolactate synthase 2 small subunit [Limnobaculum sp. M2-1]MCD1125979.1 acetolactate synthase 2 small subunit [Limnobaculum eriocheiris]
MTEHQLYIQTRFRSEVLERLLRVVRHRGFRVCKMNMNQTGNGDNINIHLTVSSERPVNLLSSQLTKLADVNSVEILNQTSQQIRA